MNMAGLALTADHPAGALKRSIFWTPSDMPKLPRPLIVKQLKYDLTPVAGLALVGHYLRAVQSVFGRLDAALPVSTRLWVTSYLLPAGSSCCSPCPRG